jgi:hypothetical protein
METTTTVWLCPPPQVAVFSRLAIWFAVAVAMVVARLAGDVGVAVVIVADPFVMECCCCCQWSGSLMSCL